MTSWCGLSCERRGGHDSQVLDDILDGDNTALGVWADSAYRSAEIEASLKEKGLRSRIHRKGRCNKPLSEREKRGNKTRSSVRVRVEHVFGAQSNDMGGTLVRSVGLVRAIRGLKTTSTYNMRFDPAFKLERGRLPESVSTILGCRRPTLSRSRK